jgi:hypothetical protein
MATKKKSLQPLVWMALVLLIGARAGASAGTADDHGPSFGETKDWLKDHGKDFTSSFSFSNDSHKHFTMTIQRIEFVLRKYDPDDTPAPGCVIHFYATIHIQEDNSDDNGGEIAAFRAEDVSDVVEVRKLEEKDLGPAVRDFDAQGCYGLVITQKDPNSDAIKMANLGTPYLEQHALPYLIIPVTNQALAERLAKALHRGIQLIQAKTAVSPGPF